VGHLGFSRFASCLLLTAISLELVAPLRCTKVFNLKGTQYFDRFMSLVLILLRFAEMGIHLHVQSPVFKSDK